LQRRVKPHHALCKLVQLTGALQYFQQHQEP